MKKILHPPRGSEDFSDITLRDFAARWMMQQCDLPQIEKYRAANSSLSQKLDLKKRLVLFGDSIIENWSFDSSSLPNLEVINRGIRGQNSSQMLLRFVDDVVEIRADFVAILAGTNDLRAFVGDPDFIVESALDRIKRNLTAMCDIAQYRGIKPLLCNLLPVGANPKAFRSAKGIEVANTWIQEFSEQRGITCVDFYGVLVDENGNLPMSLSSDAVHPNSACYKAMEGELTKHLVGLI